MRKKDYTGLENINNFGSKMIINKYRGYHNIEVYFPEYDWFIDSDMNAFKRGEIKCPYETRYFNVGYLGEGEYKFNKSNDVFIAWNSMIRRCYNNVYQKNYPTYGSCEVCEEWHNFQNFAKWYEENYYEIDGEKMNLDKDILVKHNKIYSPETCIFVPQRINELFTKSNKSRGEYPIGVSYNKGNNALMVYCNIKCKLTYLGKFQLNQVEEAFNTYKIAKEKEIKRIADEYKDKIPQELYDAMYRYEVEITD